ncbi:MAG: transcriptional coactivator p15/PC4 family protein [Candidatus Aminicenantes bacterium]|nr:transcriptional coactivator p15/PC4 family protein [Candidatus Aminicenantes bacterium]
MTAEKPDFVQNTDTNINIGFLDLSATQKLIFSVSQFRNRDYLDIRTWFQDQSGEWKPTKKGIHLNLELFNDFQGILEGLASALKTDA